MAMILVWAFFRVPETKDRTFGEVDILFDHGVNARKFRKVEVDVASGTVVQ